MKKLLVAISFVACFADSTRAGGLESLEDFVKSVRSGRADFTQVVTSPAKDGQVVRSKTSSGTFEFSRPGHFRFVYRKPFEQTIVADGQTLWLYDVDLNQVTARKQSQVLGTTPAALIASAADLRGLEAVFALASDAQQEGLEWVVATPKVKDGALQRIRVGYRGAELAVLEMVDAFGQQSTLRFTGFRANPALDSAIFQFKPPPGADVIRP